ncbi:protein of unknown function [Blastococcus sp. DSM 46786]|uniref:DUF202 domain-containing protein n=1 Tax=Blastococcus sp. DSM 46786 TaxID=1798227 RepID=UPI0008B775EF|nr:DUF202 domain-containing protein [Blastococcus sp. DSM 46786]SEK70537.1 protein of unknown function [Blastococcus sp. DSM 46786]
MTGVVPDPGRANERTALAWQRTALALIAASALLTRFTADALGLVSLASMGAAMPLAAWVFLESRARYAHDAGMRRRSRSRDGLAPLALTLATAVLALTETTAVWSR